MNLTLLKTEKRGPKPNKKEDIAMEINLDKIRYQAEAIEDVNLTPEE